MYTFKKLLLGVFAISGMTALIYEIVWVRSLQLIFGSTTYAISTMLTTFMVGFALGSFSFRNLADRIKNPILLLIFLELGIGLYGIGIQVIFSILPSIYTAIPNLPGLQFLQFILCFLVLIIPATLFGGTWPTITKAYITLDELGKDSGLLYSFNSLGAVVGSIAAGFFLIPIFGIRSTSLYAACFNLGIAFILIAVCVFKRVK